MNEPARETIEFRHIEYGYQFRIGDGQWLGATKDSHLETIARELLKPKVPEWLKRRAEVLCGTHNDPDETSRFDSWSEGLQERWLRVARAEAKFLWLELRRLNHSCPSHDLDDPCSTCKRISELEAMGGGA